MPTQIVLGVLTLALGSRSPLLGICILRTPGLRYASLDVGAYYVVEIVWRTYDNDCE